MQKKYLLHRFSILLLLLVAIPLVRPLGFLERRSMDFRSNLRRILDTPPLDDRILIVDIDDYSLDTIKSRWPWNRRLIATAITNLSTAGAKVIGVDLMFLNESQEDPEQDTVLADAIRKAGNVILISAPYVESEELFSKTIQPFDGLKKAAMGTAFTACLPDDDNVVRKMFVTNPHIANPLEAGGFTLWLEHATRYGTAPGEHDFKRRFPLLPTDSFGLLPINFHYRYQRLSIAHVINWEFHSGQVKEKVIFIGTSTALTHDLHTSTRGLIPGVDLQAYTLSTLLDESFLRRLPWWGEGVLLLVAGIAATLLIPRMTAWRGLTAVAGSVLLWYGLATGLIFTNTVLPVVRLTTMLLSLYVLLLADRYIFTLKENVKLYRDLAQKHRMEHEVDIAREIQQSMYPSVFPTLDGRISIEARSLPARELGGDYFDFFPMDDPDSLGIVVADVSGKGLNAALVVSLLKGFLKALVQAGSSPTHVLEETNQFVNTELFETTGGKVYVTMVYGIINVMNRTLCFSKAGHTTSLFLKTGGLIEKLDLNGLPCGMFSDRDLPCHFEEKTISFGPGDSMIWYTDGLVEAMNSRDEMLGLEEVLKLLKKKTGAGPKAVVDHLFKEVAYFCRGAEQHDDITIVVFGPNSSEKV